LAFPLRFWVKRQFSIHEHNSSWNATSSLLSGSSSCAVYSKFSLAKHLNPILFCTWSAYFFYVFGSQKLFARPSFIIGNNFFFWKSLFCHKMDEFKFCTFADIPAYFIVIKIHVKIKIFYFFALKSWKIGCMLDLIFS
jgi:hypothetical protein